MNLTNCPSCGGSVRCESIGWTCNKCRGFIGMSGTFYPHEGNPFLPPQTNADHIRGMTDEELVEFFHEQIGCGATFVPCGVVCFGAKSCPCYGEDSEQDCKQKILDWLQQPYKENEDER